jgi:hypothetical protein
METKEVFEHEWPFILSYLPHDLDLDDTAFQTGAIRRKREVDSASTLLRLLLAYAFCGLSLRQTAAWAEAANVAALSDVALLKRFRRASSWLALILGAKLAERASSAQFLPQGYCVRLIDATCVSKPGSAGTDWRLHLSYNLSNLTIEDLELTDSSGGETLRRFAISPGEIAVCDRGYAHRAGLWSVTESGGDFIVRLNWQNVPLQTPEGESFSILAFLRNLTDTTPGESLVQTAPDPSRGVASIPCRIVAIRKTEAAAAQSRQKAMYERAKKQRSVDPRTLESAGYVILLTSVTDGSLSAAQILELYRFRWQIEMAFKRLKSLLALDRLPAKDPDLARSYLYAKLLAALLLDDLTERFLTFSPWGFPIPQSSGVHMADTPCPAR